MLEPEIIHYGVKGMKWGRRKAQTQPGGSTTPKAPSKLNYALTGRMGKVDSYTNPEARAQRVSAGKARLVSLGASVLGVSLAMAGGSSAAGTGIRAVSQVLSLTGSAAAGYSQVKGFQAINAEQKSRNS